MGLSKKVQRKIIISNTHKNEYTHLFAQVFILVEIEDSVHSKTIVPFPLKNNETEDM